VRSRWFRGFLWTPLRVVLVYAAVGGLWILFSDRALELLVPDPAQRDQLQTFKGWFYVVVTSVLVYALVRRAHSRLQSFGAEIRAAVESMVDGVVITDRTGILEANRAALELLGVKSKAEVLGSLEEFARRFQPRNPDGSPVPLSELASARAFHGERTTRETLLRRADGREVVLSVSATPFTASGAPEGATLSIVVFRDVSATHHLEAMRDEFLATAAHELKTPLAVVKAYAQLVQRRAPAEAPALTVVQRQVDRMTRLVQHLLDASRLRLDLGDGAPERFDLARLTADVVERLRTTDGAHSFQCVAPGPVPVEGDRDRIARVLQSLLDNAVRFSPGGGPVEARVLLAGGEARVSVADHGVGIPVERQSRIFERYYRAHAGTPEDYGGLGLSLDLSREIVIRHGGRIWFESTPGLGSTFHFALPAAPEERA
jgi:PAS domain S-box-containing protein